MRIIEKIWGKKSTFYENKAIYIYDKYIKLWKKSKFYKKLVIPLWEKSHTNVIQNL